MSPAPRGYPAGCALGFNRGFAALFIFQKMGGLFAAPFDFAQGRL
jgi:hypothetical protein